MAEPSWRDHSNVVVSPDVQLIVKLTQAAYDALSPPDPAVMYIIVEE